MIEKFFSNKRNVILFIGGIVILVLVIIGVTMKIATPDNKKILNEYEKYNTKKSDDGKKYPSVHMPDNNKLVYTDYDEVLNIFKNKGDAVIYFGYAKCLYCRTAVQVLVNTAEDTELDKIYYLDVEEKDAKYDELLNVLGEELTLLENGKKKIYSPLVIFVANGDIVSYNKGTLFSQEDPYTELDRSQIEGLSEIYKYGINDVLEASK